MATKSSFFSRLSFTRNEKDPALPFQKSAHAYQPLRRKPSEYDLQELPPRPEPDSPSSDAEPAFVFDSHPSMKKSSAMHKQRMSPPVSPSRQKTPAWAPPPMAQPKPRVLFAGPPPPIATSVLLYRDVEDRGGSVPRLDASSARLPASHILFDGSATSAGRHTPRSASYSTWSLLQQRERSVQKDIQKYLDVQSAGLLAGLGRGPLNPSPGPGPSSDGDSFSRSMSDSAPTESAYTTNTRSSRLPTDRATASGAVIPVRQPRAKKIGLRGARAGLTRGIAQLTDLKAEEEKSLETALGARKRALTQLQKLTARRDSIAGELHSLETDEEEPLSRELATLNNAHAETDKQIVELEKQLAMLRSRKRTLEGRIADAKSQREAGLSGYRGALRQVEGQLSAVLTRPPVQPIDVESLGAGTSRRTSVNGKDGSRSPDSHGSRVLSPGGIEFLRLRPERRTAEMARSWWESEVQALEQRKHDVDTEKRALEEGSAVWKEAVRIVSDFENGLRKQMAGQEELDESTTGKGKAPEPTPEAKMQAQLEKMNEVIAGLSELLRTAEDKGWNLLICAVGAEQEAFREARNMFCEALRAAGVHVDDAENGQAPRPDSVGNLLQDEEDESSTPRMTQSGGARSTPKPTTERLIDTEDSDSHRGASESEDNEVPPDLFVSNVAETEDHDHDHDPDHAPDHDPNHDHDPDNLHERDDRDDSSENEVPPEFLLEHHEDGAL